MKTQVRTTQFKWIALGLVLAGFASADVTSSDGASLIQDMQQAKGLVGRAPITENGMVDTSAMEFRLDMGAGVSSEAQLPGVWEGSKDIPGFANISKPEANDSSATSTCYYCGCYYYQPYVSYYYSYYSYWYSWYFYYPTYYYYYPYSYSYAYYYYPYWY